MEEGRRRDRDGEGGARAPGSTRGPCEAPVCDNDSVCGSETVEPIEGSIHQPFTTTMMTHRFTV